MRLEHLHAFLASARPTHRSPRRLALDASLARAPSQGRIQRMEATNPDQHQVRLSPEELTATPSMEQVLLCPMQPQPLPPPLQQQEMRPAARPPPEIAPRCPRCSSRDTKFCYYNNYSYNQPRYFCKGCKRYWTKGGTLRNVPIGGNNRKKKKRPSSSSSRKPPAATPSPPPSPYHPAPQLDLSFACRLQNPHLDQACPLAGNSSHAPMISRAAPAVMPPPPPPRFLDMLRTTELLSGAVASSTVCDRLQPYGFSAGLLNASDANDMVRAGTGTGGGDVCVCGRHVMLPPFEELQGGPVPPVVGQELEAADLGSLDNGDSNRMFMDLLQRQAGGNGNTSASAEEGREYLSAGGGGSSSWNGLVNSFLT